MKRKLFFIIALACCLVLAVGILAACNDSGTSGQQTPGGENPGTGETVRFTVTFDTQGGSTLADITVENGQVIGEFTLPTKQCSRLVGFALDTAGEQMWNVLTDTVSANITLYAIWEDAHTWSEWVDTTPATCTENGERTRECEVCGATESEVIPAAHIWGEWTETIAPGCETEGERSHSCEVCGKTENEAIDALGHDYSEEYTEDIAPTCEGVGSESRHCTRCDATTDSREVAALGHNYEGAEWNHNEANHWRYCARCGKESERVLHSYDDDGVCECGVIEVAPVNEFRFISLGNNTWRLANYTGNRTNVSIPSTYNNGTVAAISDDAFSGNTAMQTLVIPDTVTSIGARAFSDCVNLTSVTLSKNLTSIGEDAFAGCTQITSATIPAMAAASIDKSVLATLHVTSGDIEANAFSDCATLVYVTIEYGVTTIGSGAFANCTGISEISVPDSVTSIGNGAFSGCSGLVEMTLPFVGGSADATTPSASTLFGYIFGSSSFPGAFETVQLYGTGEGESATYFIPRYLTSVTVGDDILFGAFYGCDRIESITLTSAMALGDYAFYNNTSLTEITIPDSVLSIGEMTFAYCTSLEEIDFPQNIVTVGVNAMLESVWYDAQPDGVIYIGKAVYDYKGIMPSDTTIELKDDTYSITAGAFSGCTNLTAVAIPDSVSEIGDGAFEGCTNIASATMPAVAIDYIPQNKLDTVSITSGAIGDNAFEGCTSLVTVTIGDGVTDMGSEAFRDCTKVVTINWNASSSNDLSSNDNAFYNAGILSDGITVNIGGDNVTRVPAYLFYVEENVNSPKIISVTINLTTKNIGNSAFLGCSSLVSIYYTDDIAGWCGISGLGNIMSSSRTLYIAGEKIAGDLVIPNGVKRISSYAFYDCKDITSVTIPDSVTVIESYAFSGCTGLMSVTIGNGVMSIGVSAFEGCTNLTEINWNAIGVNNFSSSSNVFDNAGTSGDGIIVMFGNSVTSIPAYVFERCTGLTSVTISDSVTSIGRSAFAYCSGLTSVTIGSGVTSIGDEAFYFCDDLASIYYTSDVAGWCGVSGLDEVMSSGRTLYIGGEKVEGDLVIPDGVTKIGDYAFEYCSGLTSITIPDSVTSIGDYAFYGCSAEIIWGDNPQITKIESYTFSGYQGISVTIPDSVTSIGSSAFEGCTSLTSITIPFVGATKNETSNTHFGYIFGASHYGENDSYVPASLREVVITGGTSIGGWAFWGCSGLTSVTIGNGVTSIGDSAFRDCDGLTSVTIGNDVTSIGNSAFEGCTGLTSITIPNSVTSIGSYAFYGCSDLTSVTIPNSVTSIGSYAFYGCSDLTSVTIPNSVTSIGSYAFEGCSGLTSITIPDSVTSIESGAFSGCSGLTSITIPDSVTSIESGAFSGCSGLTSITIPDSVTSIGDYAFWGCSSLESITIPFVGGSAGKTSSNTYQYPFGYIFGKSSYTGGTEVTQRYHGSSTSSTTSTTYYIPSSLRNVTVTGGNILYGAFYNCATLTSVTIGNGVTSIGERAFSYCSGLTSVTIPDSVTSIGSYAFYECSSLTSVTIPDSVTSIGERAFYGCSGLTSITIPDGVTSIGERAFSGCTGLISVTISDSVTSIESGAFSGCNSLESITIPFVGADAGKTSSDTYQYPFGYIFGASSYTGGTAVTQYYRGSSASSTYYIPSSLRSVTVTGGNILYGAFYNCSMLTSITIPDSVTSIENSAFYGCSGLTSIGLPDSVTSIGYSAFEGCAGLTSVTIPDSVTSIRGSAFQDCAGLTSITIPDSVTSIGYCAFASCSGLTSITIPDSVTSIGYSAFEGCTGLTSVTFEGTVAEWNAIEKGSRWYNNCPFTEVVCSDGTVQV